MREMMLGGEHPDTLTTMNNFAGVLGRQGKYAEAIALYERTCAGFTKVLGEEHPHTRMCHESSAYVLALQGQGRSAGVSEVLDVDKSVGGSECKSKESTLSRVARKVGIRRSQ
jgi:hypothetical protein